MTTTVASCRGRLEKRSPMIARNAVVSVALVALTAPDVGNAVETFVSNVVSTVETTEHAVWYDVVPGVRAQPTIVIDASVYPDERGVQFLVDGVPDDRNSKVRPEGFDATGPEDDSDFHVYPSMTPADGSVLEARWTDRSGVEHVSRHLVGADLPADAPLAEPAAAQWSGAEPGQNRLPVVLIDDSIYPDANGVQFFLDGESDDRSAKARPDGWDATGPQDDSEFHFYPGLTLTGGERLEARWTDESGSPYRTVLVVGAEPADQIDPPATTAPATTAPATTAPETTAPETTAPATTAPETTAPATTAPETTAPATTAPAPAVLGSWSDVAVGDGRLPTVSVDDEVYPDGQGVQFRINGVVDERSSSARPDGWDATGPRDGSTFHIHPEVTLSSGDVLEARWTDGAGVARESVHVVESVTAPTAPPATTAPTTTAPATDSPTDPPADSPSGVRPGPGNTGPRVALTRTFSSATIDEAWLQANNGGSRVIEGVHFTTMVMVRADNVTIRDFKVTTTGRYGIENAVFSGSPTTGLVLEHGEVTGPSSSGLAISNAVVRHLEIHHVGADAVKPFRNVVVEDSYVHHLGMNAGSHSDGVQMVSGGDVVIRGNFFDMPHDEPGFTNSQVFMIAPNNGPVRNVSIEGNWINGGSISVQIHSVDGVAEVVNNRFGRDYRFGLFSTTGPVVRSGNVWDDTGEPVR